MSLTPNFGMNIPDSTDVVNLLTQCYPNFTLLDGALETIRESGITTASETKSGTVHQLVRSDSHCNVIRFTATSNFVTGDSFTVDGAPVTGVAVNGTALQTGDFVINSNVLCILVGSVLTIFAGGSAALPEASDVDYDNTGSGLTATNVQDAIDEISGEVDALKDTVGTELDASLSAGATSVTFTDAAITATAKLLLFFDDVFIPFTGVTAGAGTVTYNFDALGANATATLWIVD